MSEPFAIVAATLASAGERLAGVDVRLLALAICGQLLYSVLRAAAWRNVLGAAYPERPVRLLDVAAANSAAAGISAVTVGQAGSAVKAAVVKGRIHGSTLAAVAATLGVVAAFDAVFGAGLLLAAWQLGAISYLPVPSAIPAWAFAAAGGLVIVLAALSWLARGRARRLAACLREGVIRGTAVLRQPACYLRGVAALQLLAWGTRVGVVFLFLHAFGIPASLGDALLVVVVMGMASSVPSGPGGVGAQQLAVVIALHGTASASAAISFSIGMQLVMTGFNVALGLAAGTYLFGTFRPHVIVRHGRALLAGARA